MTKMMITLEMEMKMVSAVSYLYDLSDISLDVSSESETDISKWPVNERCRKELNSLAKTHKVNPIPAYNLKLQRIAPKLYEQKLCGAIVQVKFGLINHFIKKNKRAVFTTVLREIHVL